MIGQILLHYRITEKIGEGGMGIVYKAVDTHLDRTVAVKILPPDKVSDPERKSRFVQEAKAASALRHPNIVVIHDIASDKGRDFMVMEFVEGQSLEALVGRRGLKLNEALGYAVQISDGLAKAHAAGIVHRDLKPTNVMVTGDGLVKILDFGLAKLVEESPDAGAGPTVTMGSEAKPRTEEGYILGTVAYMSPEQAEGKKVDARSDVFSFGAVLYEMLTGRKAFDRVSRIKTLAAVLNENPRPAASVSDRIPAEVERILDRCLRKDPQRRWQTMSDLKVALQDLKDDSDSGKLRAADAPLRRGRKRLALYAAAAVLTLAAAATVIVTLFAPRPAAPIEYETTRLTFDSGLTVTPTVSPDGSLMAYASDREGGGNLEIWVQQLSGGRPLRLTDHPAEDWFPSLSPDGSKIAFASSRDGGGIFLVDTLGGEPRKIVDGGWIPRFSPDGRHISFLRLPASLETTLVKMYLVPAKGGTPVHFLPEFCSHFVTQGGAPVWSPDGKHLLFRGQRIDDPRSTDWWVAPVDGGEPVRTHALEHLGLTSLIQCPVGWTGNEVLFISGTTVEGTDLFRVPIEPGSWEITGPAAPVTSGPGMKIFASLTRDGGILFNNLTVMMDAWSVDADPNRAEVSQEIRKITQDLMQKFTPSTSLDGTKVAFTAFGGVQTGKMEVRVKDLVTGQETVFPMEGIRLGQRPILSPDGSILAFRDFISGTPRTYLVGKGTGSPREFCDSCRVLDFYPNLADVLVQFHPQGLERMNIRSGERVPVLRIESGSIDGAALSPDGRWISWRSSEPDGRAAIWISPEEASRPSPSQRHLIIRDDKPLSPPDWSPNGRYLYFLSEKKGHSAIFAQGLDPLTKAPVGKAIEVLYSREGKFMLNFPKGNAMVSVAGDKIIFQATMVFGNIYLAKPKGS